MLRLFPTLAAPAILLAALSACLAAECPGNPNAIGTSRTIVVDPAEHGRIGSMDYSETLPLADREVVLTFDDGPLPPHTGKILEILASECIKATYFIVGTMARAHPALVRRVYDEGHTVGTHSMSHPIPFRALGLESARPQVDGGIAATAAALGGEEKLAPFFRFPGFGRTPAVEAYVASRNLMIWGADVPADDWKRISPQEIANRAIRRLEGKGKGILLLHDIHARTVEALPIILSELKARGFRIVHVVPAAAGRPATVTTADAWRVRPRNRSERIVAAVPALPPDFVPLPRPAPRAAIIEAARIEATRIEAARTEAARTEATPIQVASVGPLTLPHPKAMQAFALADIQSLDGRTIADKSDDDLCRLNDPAARAAAPAGARERALHPIQHRAIKKLARAMPDIHAVR